MTITMSDDSYNVDHENLKKVFKDINKQKDGEINRKEFTAFVKETYNAIEMENEQTGIKYEEKSDQKLEELSKVDVENMSEGENIESLSREVQ